MSRAAFLAARFIFVLFWLATAAYGVIAFIPFTYVEVIQFGVAPALNTFARLHPYLYWVALLGVLFTLREDFKRRATRYWVAGFAVVSGVAGLALTVHPVLATLPNDELSLRVAFVALVPLMFVALIDLGSHAGRIAWSPPTPAEDRRVFRASWMSGAFLAAVYFGIFLARFAGDATIGVAGFELPRAAVFSLAAHLVIFMAAFAAISAARSVAAYLPNPARAELVLVACLAIAGCAEIVRHLILGSVSLTGPLSIAIAVAFATAIVVSHLGVACRLYSATGRTAPSGIEVLFSSLATPSGASLPLHALGLAALAGAAFAFASTLSVMDWNFLLQKLSALLIWILTFAAFLAVAPRRAGRPRTVASYLAVGIVVLAGFKGLSAWQWGSPGLDRYAGRDPSFRVLRDLLRRPQGASSRDDAAFYRYLQEHTNIPRSVHIDPVDVRFVPPINAQPAPRPNIFIFVLDSLRRDYLSPYNPRVTFTPAIEAFAADSVVFTNAFTRYGGTGLSEPSIWVGGLLPHQQYVTPFHPLNALEKLVHEDGYQSFISIDTILRVILKPDAQTVEIDRGVLTHDLKLARSLSDLASRLRKGEAQGRPVFAYAQPQDLHISTITREGASVPKDESYPGFYAPYASRLRQADAGFGAFLLELEALHLYDDSIIVLTSDHGDSLGEDGRWGHAYTIFPEILRIPLIVHLPKAVSGRLASNPSGLAFLTDIVPSLYALLGHEPGLRNPVFGRPLFASRSRDLPSAERADSSFLVASSYGPIYGILDRNGKHLYIADSVNYTEGVHDLAPEPGAPPPVLSDDERAADRELVRESLEAIHAYYGVPGLTPPPRAD